METGSLLAVVAILSVAAFVQSSTGFGLALVCLAALPLVIPVEEGISLVTIFNLIITAMIMFVNRSGFSWKDALPLMVGALIGIPLGFYGLKAMDGSVVIRVLGAVLVLIALSELLKGRILPRLNIPRKAAFPMGIVAGVLGGSFNVGGPPVVVYTYSQNWDKIRAVAIMQSVFLTAGIFRSLLMIGAGDYNMNLFRMSVWSVVPALIAVWLGKKTLDRFPQEVLRNIVFTMILVMGLRYSVLE